MSTDRTGQDTFFVKRLGLCYRTIVCPVLSVCLSLLSETLVYCGQTFGWIKVKLDMEVGLGPGHIALDGDPAPPSPKGHSSHHFSVHAYRDQTVAHLS